MWEFRSFYEDHYPYGSQRVIDYVNKENLESVLTVVLPLDPVGTTYKEEWLRVRNMDWLKKAAVAKAAVANKETEVADEVFAGKFPALFAFMAQLRDETGGRELCKLQLFADAGVWKAALHDPNTEHSLFLTLGSPPDVFKAVEKALTADCPDWRSWGKGKAKKK